MIMGRTNGKKQAKIRNYYSNHVLNHIRIDKEISSYTQPFTIGIVKLGEVRQITLDFKNQE
ncbi:hypothetical protein DERP_005808 [Dermatophagoides pteronyssinus]|uniref:Uncharacterized protein n=1 Tax=Dermatophagoides pteronyssinus TaxID=6956 RepID=A0ABQ8J9N4_DERPT|nr:hypothetical protein DERP_005808 [Dermatophagoides pteronyssinus]